ncbi:hypothetical protein [Winogradskyella sp. PC-19]|uniref:hypothetical protein n=1 Tax=Winogradskyella sp. PC-19 TaxID=754417 RepID=UPI0012F8E3D1|nr:hypothetical protein [Winogradskyella sp. PC-19]
MKTPKKIIDLLIKDDPQLIEYVYRKYWVNDKLSKSKKLKIDENEVRKYLLKNVFNITR